jgi:hypothetical protein
MGGMQFQRLLEGGAGLFFTQVKLPLTDEFMRVGLPHAHLDKALSAGWSFICF